MLFYLVCVTLNLTPPHFPYSTMTTPLGYSCSKGIHLSFVDQINNNKMREKERGISPPNNLISLFIQDTTTWRLDSLAQAHHNKINSLRLLWRRAPCPHSLGYPVPRSWTWPVKRHTVKSGVTPVPLLYFKINEIISLFLFPLSLFPLFCFPYQLCDAIWRRVYFRPSYLLELIHRQRIAFPQCKFSVMRGIRWVVCMLPYRPADLEREATGSHFFYSENQTNHGNLSMASSR